MGYTRQHFSGLSVGPLSIILHAFNKTLLTSNWRCARLCSKLLRRSRVPPWGPHLCSRGHTAHWRLLLLLVLLWRHLAGVGCWCTWHTHGCTWHCAWLLHHGGLAWEGTGVWGPGACRHKRDRYVQGGEGSTSALLTYVHVTCRFSKLGCAQQSACRRLQSSRLVWQLQV